MSFQPIAVTVTAEAGQFDSTLTRVQKSIGKFKEGLGGIGGALTSIPLLGAAGAGIAGLASLKAIESTYKEMSSSILANNLEAKKLGVTYEELIGLQLKAGPAADEMSGSLMRFSRELGLAAQGNTESMKKLRGAGLEGAIGKSPIEGIKLLADQYKRAGSAAERAALLAQAGFRGPSGLGATLFSGGAAGIEAQIKRGRGLGLVVSDEEIDSLLRAKVAMKDLELGVRAIKEKGAIKLAPLFQDIANLGAHGDTSVIKKMIAGNLIMAAGAFAPSLMAPTSDALSELFGLQARPRKSTDELLKDEQAQQNQVLEGSITELNTKLQQEIDVIGMTATQKEVYALKTKNATDAQLELATALAKTKDQEDATQILREHNKEMEMAIHLHKQFGASQLAVTQARKGADPTLVKETERLQQVREAQQRIDSLKEGFANPADAFRKGMKELNEADIGGLLTPNVRKRRSAQLIQQLFATQNPFVNPALAESGTSEAASFTASLRNLAQNPAARPEKGDVERLLAAIDLKEGAVVAGLTDVIQAIKDNAFAVKEIP